MKELNLDGFQTMFFEDCGTLYKQCITWIDTAEGRGSSKKSNCRAISGLKAEKKNQECILFR